jgi:hypothetical protein
MSRPRFLADHDLNEHIVLGVLRREPAIEFARGRDLRLESLPDDEVLEFAAKEGFVVVSHDVNTMTAAAHSRIIAGQPMARLLVSHQTDAIAATIESLVLIWSESEAEEWQDVLCYLPL